MPNFQKLRCRYTCLVSTCRDSQAAATMHNTPRPPSKQASYYNECNSACDETQVPSTSAKHCQVESKAVKMVSYKAK